MDGGGDLAASNHSFTPLVKPPFDLVKRLNPFRPALPLPLLSRLDPDLIA